MSDSRQHDPRLLAIDDSVLIHRLMKEHLRHERIELHCAITGVEGLELAESLQPDCILLDLGMPDLDGFAVLETLHSQPSTRDIPVIVVSCHDETDEKVRALDQGAVDFVTKPFHVAELKARVRSAIRQHRLIKLLSQRARIDAMTGLWNRAYFDERLNQEVQLAVRHDQNIALVLVDLDHFKHINDRYGHLYGDAILEVFAELLNERRGHDIACRYGGEEFAVIIPQGSCEDAARMSERWRARLESLRWDRDPELRVTASFGVTDLFRTGESLPMKLVESADRAMYQSKQDGRNRVTVAPIREVFRKTA